MKTHFITLLFLSIASGTLAQQILTEQAAVDSAMKYSPLLKSAELQVKQSNYLRKTAFNLANPDVIAESPTGDFYAVGILQSLAQSPFIKAKNQTHEDPFYNTAIPIHCVRNSSAANSHRTSCR